MSAKWRKIPGFDKYEVSRDGDVRSWMPRRNYAPLPTEPCVLRAAVDKDGYRRYVLRRDGVRYYKSSHILVAEAWISPKPFEGALVLHNDGDSSNNNYKNLRWGTVKDNGADAAKHGVMPRGSSVNTSKLSESDVVAILSSDERHSDLARRFGVTPCAVWHIRAGRTWKHVAR